jgi:hypothetical protein
MACVGENRNAYKILAGKHERKRPPGRLFAVGGSNIQFLIVDLKGLVCEDVHWLHVSRERIELLAQVGALTKRCVLSGAEDFENTRI